MAAARSLGLGLALLLALCSICAPADGKKAVISWKYGLQTPHEYSAVVKAGKRVFFKWADDNPHAIQGTTASAANEFLGNGTGSMIVKKKGFLYVHVFRKPGLYEFNDAVYGNTMAGSVRVLPNPAGAYSARFQPD